jgi:hypothetical protein
MRRITTWLIAVAVAAVAIAATVHSALSDPAQNALPAVAPQPATTDPLAPPPLATETARYAPVLALLDAGTRERLAAAMRPEGIRGVLYLAAEDCTLQVLTLPDLAQEAVPSGSTCRFAVDSGAPPAAQGTARAAGRSTVAICRRGHVEVIHALPGTGASPDGAARSRIRGCAPAWKPGGTLTVVRAGELLEVRESCHRPPSRCVETILTREALAAAVAHEPTLRSLRNPRIAEVVWLSDRRFVAVVAGSAFDSEPISAVVLFRGNALVGVASVERPILDLVRISPQRSYVAVRAGSGEGIFVLDLRKNGLTVARFPPWAPPAPTDIRGIAWSPDERFTAVASRRSVYVFRTDEPRKGFIGLPFAVSDLAWGP